MGDGLYIYGLALESRIFDYGEDEGGNMGEAIVINNKIIMK